MDPKMKGSVLLACADSKEEVLKALREDVYYRCGVWDWEKVQLYPVCIYISPFGFADPTEVQVCA